MRIALQLIERQTVQLQKDAKSKGRILFKNVQQIIINTPWQSVVRKNDIPIFLEPLYKLTGKISQDNYRVNDTDVENFQKLSTQFWSYLETINPNEKKNFVKLSTEISELHQLWKKHGTSAGLTIKWFAQKMFKLAKTLTDLQRTAMMYMAGSVGHLLEHWFKEGYVFAMDTIIYSFVAMFEITISNPDIRSNYHGKVGIDISENLSNIPEVYYSNIKPFDMDGFSGTPMQGVEWVALAMKSMPAVVIIGINNIMLRCAGTLDVLLKYFTQLFHNEHKLINFEKDTLELRNIAVGLIESGVVPTENQRRLQKAVSELERIKRNLPKPGVVSPQLVTLLLRKIYYKEEIDSCIGKQIIEQRFGLGAEELVTGAHEAHELLRKEIELSFYAQNKSTNPQNVEGGFGDWCGKKKQPTEEEKKEKSKAEQEDEEKEARFRRRALARRIDELTQDQQGRDEYLLLLEKERRGKEYELAVERARIQPHVGNLLEENLETNKQILQTQKKSFIPKGTQQLTRAGESVRSFGEQAIEYVVQKERDILDWIDQIDYEERYVKSKIARDRRYFTQIEKRWLKILLLICGIGVVLVYGFTWFKGVEQAAAAVTVDAMRLKAQSSQSQGIFELLYSHAMTIRGSVTSYTPTVYDLQNSGAQLLQLLHVYVPTKAGDFVSFINKYSITLQQIILETKNESLRKLAVEAADNVAQAIQLTTLNGRGALLAQKLALKSTRAVLEISTVGLLDGQLPSDLDTVFAGIRSASGKGITVLTGLWGAINPDPSRFVSGSGLLSLVATRASKNTVDAVQKQFEAYSGILLGGFILLIILVSGFSRMFAAMSMDSYDTVSSGLGILTGTMVAMHTAWNIIFGKIAEATAANNEVFWDQMQRLMGPIGLAAGLISFFSPFGWLNQGVGLVSNSLKSMIQRRGQPAPPAPAALPPAQPTPAALPPAQPDPTQSLQNSQKQEFMLKNPSLRLRNEYVDGSFSERKNVVLQLEQKQSDSLVKRLESKSYKKEEEEEQQSEEASSSDELSTGLGSCIVCTQKAQFVCSHCQIKYYCDAVCASLNWSKENNSHKK